MLGNNDVHDFANSNSTSHQHVHWGENTRALSARIEATPPRFRAAMQPHAALMHVVAI